jgi:hypothetical protein
VIFHRFSQAIKRQNWFTVILEILIVVVGIFLGLQVDDWNETRKYRQQESVYLAKISDDLTSMRTDLIGKVEAYKGKIQTMTAALHALETCDASEQAIADVKFTMERYQSTPPIDYLDATYNEMVASGALARIKDQELKRKIAFGFSALGSLNTTVRSYRTSLPVIDEIVWGTISYSFGGEVNSQIATFDIAGICSNTKLRNAVVEMIDIQVDARIRVEFALEAIEELLGLLGDTD